MAGRDLLQGDGLPVVKDRRGGDAAALGGADDLDDGSPGRPGLDRSADLGLVLGPEGVGRVAGVRGHLRPLDQLGDAREEGVVGGRKDDSPSAAW